MNFEIKLVDDKRERFANYHYTIHQNGRLVARYWHDFRGDDHGIEFLDGRSEAWPVGSILDFFSGGGPRALRLTERAVTYLEQKLGP